MEQLQEAIWQAAIVILVGLVGYLSRALKKWLDSMEVTEALKGKEWIVSWVVKGIEQGYQHLDGEAKLQLAKEETIQFFHKNGLNVDLDELNALIEAMVFEMNKELKPKQIDANVIELEDVQDANE